MTIDEYELDVPQSGMEWITANQRLHWTVRSKRTKAWREACMWSAVRAKIPHLDQAHIICELRFSTKHRRDPANWAPTAKACVDGLVDAGVFDDDSHLYVTGPDMRIGPVVPAMMRGLRLHLYPERNWS